MLLIPWWLRDVNTCCFTLDGLRANKDVLSPWWHSNAIWSMMALVQTQRCYLVRDGPGADTAAFTPLNPFILEEEGLTCGTLELASRSSCDISCVCAFNAFFTFSISTSVCLFIADFISLISFARMICVSREVRVDVHCSLHASKV